MVQTYNESELSQIDNQYESNDYEGNDYDGNDYDGDEYYEDSQASEIEKFTESEKVVEGFGNGGNTALIVFLVLFVVFGLLYYFYIAPYYRLYRGFM